MAASGCGFLAQLSQMTRGGRQNSEGTGREGGVFYCRNVGGFAWSGRGVCLRGLQPSRRLSHSLRSMRQQGTSARAVPKATLQASSCVERMRREHGRPRAAGSDSVDATRGAEAELATGVPEDEEHKNGPDGHRERGCGCRGGQVGVAQVPRQGREATIRHLSEANMCSKSR